MLAGFIECFLHEEFAISSLSTEIFCDMLVSELPGLRRVGVSGIIRILFFMKRRSVNRSPYKMTLKGYGLKPQWTEKYIRSSLDTSPDLFSECPFIDEDPGGWCAWQKEIVGYVKGSEEEYLRLNPADQAAFETAKKRFLDPQYLQKLLDYFALEQPSDSNSRESFSSLAVSFYKTLFQMFDLSLFEIVKPIISNFCHAYDVQSKQRAAAEIIAGLLRGSKHWGPSKIENLFDWLIPILAKTFDGINLESLSYWNDMIRASF